MLPERFDNLLIRIGNPTLEHPVFYKCPVTSLDKGTQPFVVCDG